MLFVKYRLVIPFELLLAVIVIFTGRLLPSDDDVIDELISA